MGLSRSSSSGLGPDQSSFWELVHCLHRKSVVRFVSSALFPFPEPAPPLVYAAGQSVGKYIRARAALGLPRALL